MKQGLPMDYVCPVCGNSTPLIVKSMTMEANIDVRIMYELGCFHTEVISKVTESISQLMGSE